MLRSRYSLTAAVVLFAMVIGGSAVAVQPAPAAADCNFCDIMNWTKAKLNDSGPTGLLWLKNLLGSDAALLDQLDCAVADMNGGLVDNMPLPNGMLDGDFELRVIYELMINAGQYAQLSSGTMAGQVKPGVDAALVRTNFVKNYQNLFTDGVNTLVTLLPSVWGLLVSNFGAPPLTPELQATVSALFPKLLTIFAGYATEGDEDSLATVIAVVTMLKGVDVVGGMVADMVSDPTKYGVMPTFLGPDGDADGDGYTNKQEYDAFAGAKDSAAYINAVLNPAVVPGGTTEGEGEGAADTATTYPSGGIMVEVGGQIDILVTTTLTGTLTYEWYFNGNVLDLQTDARLIIDDVQLSDEGQYRCRVSNGAKASVLSAPVSVDVVPEGSLPLAGGLGLGVLASVCALGGALVIRRKK